MEKRCTGVKKLSSQFIRFFQKQPCKNNQTQIICGKTKIVIKQDDILRQSKDPFYVELEEDFVATFGDSINQMLKTGSCPNEIDY